MRCMTAFASSSFMSILEKDIMSQFIREKLGTIKDPHVYMSHWNPTKKYSNIQLSGCMFLISTNIWNFEQDTNYVAMKWFSWMICVWIYIFFHFSWLNSGLFVSFRVSEKCPLLGRKTLLFAYLYGFIVHKYANENK